MNTRLALALPAFCLLVGCGGPTYLPVDRLGPPLAVHAVADKAEPGALEFLADGNGGRYYFPDRQLTGIRAESVSVEPTQSTNKVVVQLSTADRDRLRALAMANPDTKYFGIRFESTPAAPEPGGGLTRGAVIFHTFTMGALAGDGKLTLTRSTSDEAKLLATRLVGR